MEVMARVHECWEPTQILEISPKLDSYRQGSPPSPIEDLHDGGDILKKHNCKRCLKLNSGYEKNLISTTWQKFLQPEISGDRNFCYIVGISFFPHPD